MTFTSAREAEKKFRGGPMHRTVLHALLLLGALVFAGCQAGDDLTTPNPGPETVSVNGVDLLVGDIHGEHALILSDGGSGSGSSGSGSSGSDSGSSGSGSGNRDSEWISRSNGGKLQISGADFQISKYSILKSSQIVMERSPDTFGVWTIHFDPSGLTFAPPARLTIDVEDISGIDPARLKIAGASSGLEDWQVLGGTYDPDDETVSIDVYHFSRYALCVE
jgi:hypothetical protein